VEATEYQTPEAIISSIADWHHRDVRCEALGGGITNLNYVVTVDGGPAAGGAKYVLRIPGKGTDLFIDRDNERLCSIAAAQAGVAPPVAYTVGDAMVMVFIDGETMHPDTLAGHPDRIRQAVQLVKQVHERATFPLAIDVFEMIRRYTAMARDVKAPFPPEFDLMFRVCDEIERAMRRDQPPAVACHNDLLSENFIIDRGGRMWIIDWEYGGMADPYFDLGDFCTEHPFTEEEERLILTTYCGTMDEPRYSRMMLHKLVSDLWWSVWAMIQSRISTIDFDFIEYGMGRVRRFQTNAVHPDYGTWIATV
jgi:thiamine kinase-like enzyme